MQTQGALRGLELGALRGRMRRQIARHRNENVFALLGAAPFFILPHAGFEHLKCVELGVFAHHSPSEGDDQRLDRSALRQIARGDARRFVHELLCVERLQKLRAQLVGIVRAFCRVARSGQRRRRNVRAI